MKKQSSVFAVVLLIISTATLFSQQPVPDWSAWKFVVGEWVAEGGGRPGEGTAEFSFLPDLQNRILVRKNHNIYPAANGRPEFIHDDLLIVYQDSTTKGIYFDNEGHVIQYAASVSANGKTITLVSEPVPGTPRFRLRYSDEGNGELKITFEIAQPGTPEEFKTYVEGKARRK